MKGFGWHEGDRSEYLARFAFSTIGYCSAVPRQYDHFGVDFFAHLARREENSRLVATGRAVCAQVKSDSKPVLLEKPEHLRCLYDPSVPFFYVVIEKKEHAIQVFTTIDRLNAHWLGWSARVWLIPGEGEALKPKEAADNDHLLYLGKPIYSKPLAVLEDEATKRNERELFLRIIEGWAWWESLHLAFKESHFPLYTRVKNYTTNEPPPRDPDHLEHLYYPSAGHLEAYCRGDTFTH